MAGFLSNKLGRFLISLGSFSHRRHFDRFFSGWVSCWARR